MKNINYTILQYLYKNDSGDFLDITKAFKGNISSKEAVNHAFHELKDYIEREYGDAYVWSIDDPIPNREEEPLSKARINQKGRDYFRDLMLKEQSLIASKRTLYITAVGVVAAVIGILLAL